MYKRTCKMCGAPFESEQKQTQYCSRECAGLFQEENRKQRRRRLSEQEIVGKRSRPLYQIVKLAADAGMSYGKYVELYLKD